MENDYYFQFNDWPMKKFLIIAITLQLLFLCLTFLKLNDVTIPILYEIVGFFYLSFLPGILLLRIMRIHKIGSIPAILYSLGLSISFLFLIGFLLNCLLPLFGFFHPITFFNVFISIYSSIAFLTLISYLSDKNFNSSITISKPAITKVLLLIILPPFLAIIGSYVMNNYNNNIFQILFICYITILVIAFNFIDIKKTYYPIAIFSITLSLLLHTSLISNYVWGWDLQTEIYLADLVLQNAYWNFTQISNYNAMLSITVLAPIYSYMLNMKLVWVFKIVYPILFSFLPLGLYHIYKKQTNNKIAFSASFFFILFFTFYYEIVTIARQEIAEIFFLLLVMIMISSKIKNVKKSLLLIIFGISLAVSHYSLSYIYILFITLSFLIIVFSKKNHKLYNFFSRFETKKTINLTFILFFIIFTLAWYIYVSNSSIFEALINIQNQIITGINKELFNPETSQGMNVLLSSDKSFLHNFSRYLQIFSQILILIGIIKTVTKRKKYNFDNEYLVFTFIAVLILIFSIIIPYFASSLNISRFYHITLIILAPFFIIGGCELFNFMLSFWQKNHLKPFKIVTLLLIVLFLFNSGVIYQLSNEKPSVMALDNNMDFPKFNIYETSSGSWLKNSGGDFPVYADNYRYLLLISKGLNFELLNQNFRINKNSYIYLGRYNTINNEFLINYRKKAIKEYKYLTFNMQSFNKIYDNGESRIMENPHFGEILHD
jgi:uncharacterized membrane protein